MHGLQGKTNKKNWIVFLKMDADSSAIADAIEDFSKGVKKIKKHEGGDDWNDCNTNASEWIDK